MLPICGSSGGAATFTSALWPEITSPEGSASTVVIPADASLVSSGIVDLHGVGGARLRLRIWLRFPALDLGARAEVLRQLGRRAARRARVAEIDQARVHGESGAVDDVRRRSEP
jgi:hypothetical protein